MASIALQPAQPSSPRCLQLRCSPRSLAARDGFNCLLQPGSPRWLQLPAAARQPAMPLVAAAGYVRRPLEWHCSTPAGLFLALVIGALSGYTGLSSGVI
ncbi:hypothetical protein VFPFJ_02306 [Purpureocillium lilacinum]|uniref:Uncharacterized protein n=1 Tax=Purpureocillium lilacinum TaxID=33203 RepID=A0A179HRQ4_PURLI|nr:hypothetical protein VFPFJ_02306 [Purpureocillium lilacinum]OAQ93145.1 hypothetical protein VFPFJ_02306 [Purpureocillium lilacinum]